nr:hypothetical protein [Prevotella sp.]
MAGREKNCKWYFADQPNVQEVGPNNAMEQSFKNHPYAALVRESIQNSLDAVDDKSVPVQVVFSFREMNGCDYPEFFSLKEHIKGCLDYYSNNYNAKAIYEPMMKFFADETHHNHLGYIRVSDYNTKGMSYEKDKTDSPFYAFVRSAGVSAKDDTSAGGSFGFGKAAYYLLSPISTIMVSTCTKNGDRFFEGASSLCTHTYQGKKKVAFGYYDDQEGKPISDEADIPAQFRRAEPGTDINILGFKMKYKDEAVKEMIEAVLRNFWFAVYEGKLEVNVNDVVNITKNTIADLMEEYFEGIEDNTRKAGYYNPRPYFDAVRFANTSSKYRLIEEKLPLLGHVCFYVFKCKGAADKIAYMRAPQMLVYSQKNKTNYGMYGVFYCDSEEGNDMLRNMENPAHTEWKATNWRSRGRQNGMGRQVLRELDEFINECLNKVFSLKDKATLDIKGLEDFLYIPTSFDDDDLEMEDMPESVEGKPTGYLQDEGSSYTTDIPKSEDNPTVMPKSNPPSTGHVLINKSTNATNETGGKLLSGHGEAKKKPNSQGIQKPGNASETKKEDEKGEKGLFATPINIPYRTFSQVEGGKIYHYVVLHPNEEVGNVRLHFYAVGEDSDEELQVEESNIGNVSGNIVRDVHLPEGRLRLRVRFTDNMKHSIKLAAEELYEV